MKTHETLTDHGEKVSLNLDLIVEALKFYTLKCTEKMSIDILCDAVDEYRKIVGWSERVRKAIIDEQEREIAEAIMGDEPDEQ